MNRPVSAERSAVTEPPLVPPRRAVAALVVIAAGAFCFVTSETLPSGMLTLIASGLGESVSATGQLITVYAAVVMIFSLPLTGLTKRVPRRGLLAGTLVVFAVASLVAAMAQTFEALVVARVISGLAHALFWSVAAAAATGLFPPDIRGRMVARLSVGSALGPVLGVPLATWLAQMTDWRLPFVALTVIGLVLGVCVFVLLPSYSPELGGAARGTSPDARRFGILLVVVCVAVIGGMATMTYRASYILDHANFPDAWLAIVLGISGGAGTVGTLAVGRYLDRHPQASLVVVLIGLGLSTFGLWTLGASQIAVIGAFVLNGACFGAMVATLMHRGLLFAPGNTDIAMAAVSTVFNLGIAGGAFFGGRVVDTWAVGAVPALSTGLIAVALVVVLLEPLSAGGSRGAPSAEPEPEPERRLIGAVSKEES